MYSTLLIQETKDRKVCNRTREEEILRPNPPGPTDPVWSADIWDTGHLSHKMLLLVSPSVF